MSLVHHLETVDLSRANSSASHLADLSCSANRVLILLNFFLDITKTSLQQTQFIKVSLTATMCYFYEKNNSSKENIVSFKETK